jgi:O-Antigen ligase
MPTISSIFLVLSFVLAVLIGPQTRSWSWGPAMLALGISVLAALPPVWRKGRAQGDFGIISLALLTAGWFAWRAWISPVAEHGEADLLLLCAAIGAFVAIRGIVGDSRAERILIWGVALLLLANLVVIGMQVRDPGYSPIFRTRAGPRMISGFFAHYNETANYLIASSLLVGAAALVGRHWVPTRCLFGLLTLAGLAGVWLSNSRGGILGAAIGCGVLAAVLLVIGYRRKAKWFAPAVVTVPVIGGIAIAAFLFMGWESAQETRKVKDTSVNILLDNDCRLYFLGMAVSCIGEHPLAGGGSRSFGWECYQKWDARAQGFGGARPDLVHNEMVQAATDYGVIGAGLLVGLLGTLTIVCLIRVIFEKLPAPPDTRDAWRLGGTAALVGMLVQSSFSFVFHLLPGILLLGICLGMMSRAEGAASSAKAIGTRILVTLSALACLVPMFATGIKGSRVTGILWASK